MEDRHNVQKIEALNTIRAWLETVEANLGSTDTDWGKSRQLLLQYLKADVQAMMDKNYGDMSDNAIALYSTLR